MRYKVLFIVGGFKDGGGTIRVEKLLKYLPLSSFKGVVLTKKINKSSFYEVCEGTSVYRTKELDLGKIFQKIKYIFKTVRISSAHDMSATNFITNQRLSDKLLIPDSDIFWAINAIFSVNKIILRESIDIIYSSSPHASSHLVALLYRKLYNSKIPWVVEFRDPWTLNPFRSRKFFVIDKIDHYLEKMVLKNADEIIVTSEVYKTDFLDKYSFLSPQKISYIPNGFDSEDFSGLNKINNNKIIRIVHAGNFYGKRSLTPFLIALNEIYKNYPMYKGKIIFEQYGNIDPDGEFYNNLNPNPLFMRKETIPHIESLQQMLNADWLLLVPGPGLGTMPGKLYEYLATGNPIIGLIDEGPAKKLIEELNVGYVIPTDDIKSIENTIIDIVEGKSKYSTYDPLNKKITRFDRKNIALEISNLLFKYE
jgi:glycosyltransferase involved in cell wall biosynthesis